MDNRILVVVLLGAVGMWTPGAMALPVEVPDFAVEPLTPDFHISPILPGEGLSANLAGSPLLTYGEIDPTTGTEDVLVMSWEPFDPNEPAQAGWELVFDEDPDLTNQTISLSISPPGVGGGPNPTVGIAHLEVVIVDINGLSAGGWGFNTDQGLLTLGHDPALSGKSSVPPAAPLPMASLAMNFMQTVNINIGSGPAAGSATVSGGPLGPLGPLVGPNYLVQGNGGDITKAMKIGPGSIKGNSRGNVTGQEHRHLPMKEVT